MRALGVVGVAMAVALVAGCATTQSGPGSSGGAAATSSSACSTAVLLTDEDNQSTVCVAQGGTVTLVLAGGPGANWAPIQLTGSGLAEQPPVITPTGGVSAKYRATAAGTAELSSSRSACPPPTAGMAACHALQAFKVTVTVR